MAGSEEMGGDRRALVRARLAAGGVIPAHPLALDASRRLDERRQRALSRYYLAAGVNGLAVGVHTTQFAIHDQKLGLLQPVLAIAAEEMNRAERGRAESLIRVAGICGDTPQAVREASLARELGFHFGLVSLAAFRGQTIERMLEHCRAVAEVVDVFGFYLQPSVGGVVLPLEFWRKFCQIDNAVAIKVAAFDRYRTLDVVRAVAESGRNDIALYTGNDDNIILDLLSPHRVAVDGRIVMRHFVGGLLGQWAVWSAKAVDLWRQCRVLAVSGAPIPHDMLQRAVDLTDANGAIFDAANGFRGCIAGIHEVLRRQGLLAGRWCLKDDEELSPGQAEEIERVSIAYPELTDDSFVAEHRDAWLSG
jgi:dihydrodipicolinate synthase/N-acetylneuraminate lyase